MMVVRHRSREFSKLVSKFFSVVGDDAFLHFCLDNSKFMAKYVHFVFRKYVRELQEHSHHYARVLMCRHNANRCDERLNSVSRACHQYFMCMVLQLRTYGEMRDLGTVNKFQEFFREFLLLSTECQLFEDSKKRRAAGI